MLEREEREGEGEERIREKEKKLRRKRRTVKAGRQTSTHAKTFLEAAQLLAGKEVAPECPM